MAESSPKRLENTVGKGEIARTENTYSVAVYEKYLRLGQLIIFEPLRENYHFSQPS